MTDWTITDADRELFARDLQTFVPERIVDAHVHWYRQSDFPESGRPAMVASGPEIAGSDAFNSAMSELLPGRRVAPIAFPLPNAALDAAAANQFLIDELSRSPQARGQLLVTPADDPEQIRETVRRHGLVGLKCYHVYAPTTPTFQAEISAFLPDAQLQIAHDEHLTITLHIVKSTALADAGNQEWIRDRCQRYPGMRLILAHAARGFNPHHTISGIAAIAGLNNVWFDTSVVTDSGAIEAIVRTFGPQRVLYGSDYPVSQLRGRCVALGDSFFWISAANTQLQVPYADLQLSLIGLEALRTLKVAAMSLGLSDRDVEAIFCENARELWSLPVV